MSHVSGGGDTDGRPWPDLSEPRAEVVRDWKAVANMRIEREDPQESVPGPGGWRPRCMHVVDEVRERVVQRGDREKLQLETVVQDVWRHPERDVAKMAK
jgi:hypothetical protein